MPVQVNVAADQQNLINSIERGVRAYNQRFSKSNTINLNINERGFTQPLGRITGAVNDFESAMAASNARVIAFGASTAVLGTAIAGFRSLAKASIEVEKNLADVNRILQLSTSELQTFGKELFNISKRTATSFNDASKALLEFSRQGLSAEETLRRTNDALTLTRLAGLGAEASVAALTATVNGFAKSGITTTQVLNKLVAVEQAFAVSARDLSEGLSRTGQAAQEAGVNIDQLNALISAAQQRTARGGAVIGNALKTIFTRLQRSDTLDRLEEFNIAVRDVQGNTLPATTVLQNFAAAYNRLADAQRAQLSEQVAGVYQVNILKAIVSDLNSEQSIYNAALIKGASATNEASRANAQLNQTLSALLVQVGNNTQQLASTIGSVTFEPLAKSAAKAANSIVETITDIITGEGLGSDLANGLLKGIRNVLAGPGAIAAFYTLFKLVQSSFTYVAQALPQIAGITTESQKRKNLEQAILGILQSESNISKSLLGNAGNQAQQAKILLGVAKQQTDQYREQLRLAGSLATTLRGQGVSAGARGLQTGRTRSGGYIPASTKMAERAGAFAGGYAPGKVVNSPVGGVMNTAEDIKYMPGFAQPFINPPKNSRAGKLHRANAVRQVGVDPYQYRGFVPNFGVGGQFLEGRIFEKNVGKLIGVNPTYNEAIDYGLVSKGAVSKVNQKFKFDPSFYTGRKAFADAHSGKGHAAAVNISKVLTHLGLKYRQLKEVAPNLFELNPNYTEIVRGNPDAKSFSQTTRISSLQPKAQAQFLSGVEATENVLGKKIRMNFSQDNVKVPADKVFKSKSRYDDFDVDKAFVVRDTSRRNKHGGYVPNFAPAGYRNPFTGALNNAAIARGLRTGALTEKQAQEMGYTTSGSKIDARKAKRASAVNALNYKMVYVPWDIEGFRAGRSGGRLNIAQGTAYENFILSLLASGQLKGTTSLGQPFSLPARTDIRNNEGLKGGQNARIDGYSLSAGEMYEMKAGGPGDTLAGLQNKFIKALENNPEILNPKRKWKNYVFRTTAAKGRGASGGFIPNLAYKGEVMDLEEFISGQKAIYSETPFPHVRNESQPTFASAIADHGGLGNALKDSYRNQSAAGLTYGGYVPNFAFRLPSDDLSLKGGGKNLIEEKRQKLAREIDKAINSYKKGKVTRDQLQTQLKQLYGTYKLSEKSEKKVQQAVDRRTRAVDRLRERENKSNGRGGRFSAGLQGASTAIAIGGPLLAGQAEQYFFGGRERADLTANERMAQSGLSVGLTSLSTGAGIGAAFGPIGAIVGGVAGGFVGLIAAQKAATLSTEELAEANAKAAEQAQKDINAASSYIEAQRKLSSLMSSGASQTEIEAASSALTKNFNDIKDSKLQDMFLATGGNLDLMNKKLMEYTNLVARRGAAEAFLSSDFSRPAEQIGSQLGIATAGMDEKVVSDFFTRISKLSELGNLDEKIADVDNRLKGLDMGGPIFSRYYGQRRSLSQERDTLFKTLSTEDRLGIDPKALSSEGSSKSIFKTLAEKTAEFLGITKETSALYDDIVKNFADSLANGKSLEKVIEQFGKLASNKDLANLINKGQNAATETFNSVFRRLREGFSQLDAQAKASFEQARSKNKIDSALNDFADSINDQMASFIMGNVTDAQKYQLQQQNASRVAEAAIARSNREFRDFDAKQNQDRAEFLLKNTEDITKIFEDNLSKSQVTAQAFETILPSIKAGDYGVDVQNVLNQGREAARQQAIKSLNEFAERNALVGDATQGALLAVRPEAFQNEGDFERAFNNLNRFYNTLEEESPLVGELADSYRKVQEAQTVLLAFNNKDSETKIKNALDERKRNLDNFDLFQRTAREEAEVAKALAEEKIRFDKLIAQERAKTDNEILENQRRISEQISRAQYEVGLENINSQRGIAAIDRTLSDPRVFYGLDRTQRNEERFRLEDDRLKLQRDMEQRILDQEIAQSNLEIISRANNTDALMLLNETVANQYRDQLKSEGAGGKVAQEIANYRMAGASEADIAKMVGAEAYTREMSYVENNQRIANAQALRNMSRTEPGAALTQQEINSFLEKAKEMPGVVGDEARKLQRVNDLRRANVKATNENVDAQRELERTVAREQSTMAGAFRKGVGEMNQQSQDILLNLAETAPSRFADGMANALSEVAQGTKSLGDAFTDMAIDFGRMLQQEVFRALAAKAVGSLLGNFSLPTPAGQTGGLMSKGIIKAQNGMYISGGRTGDRNLALLEDGEYVLNRNAVKSMGGPRALDRLNFGMAPRFQGGGGYSMEAARSLKNGEYDYTGDLMFNGANIGAINPDLYSAYAFENDAYFQRRRELARERFQRQIQKRFERRQKRAQLVGAIIGAAGSMFMSAGLGKMFTPTSTTTGGAFGAGQTTSSFKGLYSKGLNPFKRITSDHLPASLATPLNTVQKGGLIGYNSGGFVPHGSRLSDTIPAMLTGGEYVMNNSAVKKYGLGTMNSMNAGSYQSGGMASTTNNTNNNSTSISINVDRSGKAVYGASTNSYDKDDIVLSKEMARQINNLVLKSMVNEKRYGGELYKNPLRT